MSDFSGRTALVTGGSKGIGLATGRALAAAGADVVLCARDPEGLRVAAVAIDDEVQRTVRTVAGDLSTSGGVAAAVAEVTSLLGHVDVLVNVAGSAPPGRVGDLSDEQWETALNLKLLGYIRLTKAMLPGMVERAFGRIVNVAGTSGRQPESWLLTAGVANAGVMTFTRGVAADVAADGVTINAVCPGPTETTRWQGMVGAHARLHDVSDADAQQRLLANIPAGRIATPEDVANAVLFFASPDAGHVTGQSLMVDGGMVRSV